MPTINQLVRKPRKSKVEKSKSPALNVGYNSHKKSSNKRFFTTKNVVLQLVLEQWHLKKT